MNQPERFPPVFAPPNVTVRGLGVSRGERVLFADLSFEVQAGGVLLLRGPNGVGKSTLLMTLAGIVRPDAGEIEGIGREDVHLLTYQSGLKGRLSVSENLQFWRDMNGATGTQLDEALERVGIGGLAGLEAGYLSSGQLRRLALARLLVSARPVWLLDEPSAALDAAGERLLGALIDAHRGAGGIVIVATHHDLLLAEARGVETIMLGGPA
ncbi:heme ABC exporter ATP-binding protein CcmA [Devosia sp.]|uniref:heme ABC exporter ATP-binding protein CcmA n=1 Tax=Devosia sp. TaxID=1871048 RepID=UPI001AD54910|nr:heme ABC exporter ATP-binding protein CcmA [Devosia sp.]MBN9310977.1 heme ABC exporter ATP-binding protein CcmA [Devosia sp.]